MKKVKIEIEGMSCSSCEGHVKAELENIDAKKIKVSAKYKFAEFNIKEDIPESKIKEAIKLAGYIPKKIVFMAIKKGFIGRLFK